MKTLLDSGEAGGTAIITRERPVAAVDAGVLAELLKVQPPFEVLSSVTDNQVAFWLADELVIDDANLVARILRDQLQVTESDFYRCVQREELPP